MEFRVLHILSGDLWGGAEAQMLLQIEAQRAAGADARALLFNDSETARRYRERNIPVIQLDEKAGIIELRKRAIHSAREFRPSLIVSHGYKETVIASLVRGACKIPFISTFHGWSESYGGARKLKMLVYARLYLFLSRHKADGCVTVTRALSDQLKLKAAVIQNVAEIPVVSLKGELLPPGIDRERRAIVCVGRLVPVKRLDRALDAFQSLLAGWRSEHGPRPMLYIAGEGELENSLRGQSALLGLHSDVSFLGFRNDVPQIIEKADALLLTSESEGLPTVLIEALLAGTPAVLTDLPGIREALEAAPGFPALLVSRQEPGEYAKALLKVLQEPIDISGDLLRRIRDWFQPSRAAKEALQFYHQIIS